MGSFFESGHLIFRIPLLIRGVSLYVHAGSSRSSPPMLIVGIIVLFFLVLNANCSSGWDICVPEKKMKENKMKEDNVKESIFMKQLRRIQEYSSSL